MLITDNNVKKHLNITVCQKYNRKKGIGYFYVVEIEFYAFRLIMNAYSRTRVSPLINVWLNNVL